MRVVALCSSFLIVAGWPWRLACVVRVGNSTAEIYGFRSVVQSWGSHCEWLVAIIPRAAQEQLHLALEDILDAPFKVIQLDDAPSDPRDVLELTRLSVRTISGGAANLACAVSRPWIFVVPQNLFTYLDDQQGHRGHLSIQCGALFCETGPPKQRTRPRPLWPPMCGRRLE
ncbi:unnamed protein product, partial [Cladocopium goreaui]